jgi:hypothetical protein
MRTLLACLVVGGLVACGGTTGASDDDTAGASADQTGTTILLDCSVFESGGGPDQQVTVIKKADGLVLRELTNIGSTEERPLSDEEWAKKDLKLRHEEFDGPDAVNRLWKEKGEWLNESKGGGWATYGYAYCTKEKK